MAFLLAAFGPVASSEWTSMVRGLDGDERFHLSDWEDAEATVRLGILSTNGAPFSGLCVAEDGVAAAVGPATGAERAAAAVLHAYRQTGAARLADLHGQYAYVLWDRHARALLVGCDAVGLRAPAYSWDGKCFLLSTRAVALRNRSGAPAGLDAAYLAHALSGLWARTASATAFQGIRRMMGGDRIRVSARGLERLAGDRLAFQVPRLGDGESVVRELGEVLTRAIDGRAEQGPSCVALSGGVDSCVVATFLARRRPHIDAFSLVAPAGSPGDARALAPLVAVFPNMRHHPVVLTGDVEDPLESGLIPDDPICAGPVLQPGRVALLRAVRDAGCRRMFDGEGGDELFDIAWRPGDLVREAAIGQVLSALRSRASRRRLLRDFVASSRSLAGNLLLERVKKGLRVRRPWLRSSFWESVSFASAWSEAAAFARLPSARDRMPEILGAHARYWRVQELARISAGVENSSPFLDRRVVELVGSVHASVAMDLRHGKALLRRLAAQRVPPEIAWRPKNEPLSDWLIDRWFSQDANVHRMIGQIKSSDVLAEHVDSAAVLAAVDQARRVGRPNWLSSAIVALGALAQWVTAVETR